MWSRASSEPARASARAPRYSPATDVARASAAARVWVTLALVTSALGQLGACSSTPPRSKPPAPAPAASAPAAAHPASAAGAGTAAAPASGTAAANAAKAAPGGAAATPAAPPAPAAVHPEVTPAARADFDRAVQYMRAGNAVEAELVAGGAAGCAAAGADAAGAGAGAFARGGVELQAASWVSAEALSASVTQR